MKKKINTKYIKEWINKNPGNYYPSTEEKDGIAKSSSLTYNQVNDWFARWRSGKVELEVSEKKAEQAEPSSTKKRKFISISSTPNSIRNQQDKKTKTKLPKVQTYTTNNNPISDENIETNFQENSRGNESDIAKKLLEKSYSPTNFQQQFLSEEKHKKENLLAETPLSDSSDVSFSFTTEFALPPLFETIQSNVELIQSNVELDKEQTVLASFESIRFDNTGTHYSSVSKMPSTSNQSFNEHIYQSLDEDIYQSLDPQDNQVVIGYENNVHNVSKETLQLGSDAAVTQKIISDKQLTETHESKMNSMIGELTLADFSIRLTSPTAPKSGQQDQNKEFIRPTSKKIKLKYEDGTDVPSEANIIKLGNNRFATTNGEIKKIYTANALKGRALKYEDGTNVPSEAKIIIEGKKKFVIVNGEKKQVFTLSNWRTKRLQYKDGTDVPSETKIIIEGKKKFVIVNGEKTQIYTANALKKRRFKYKNRTNVPSETTIAAYKQLASEKNKTNPPSQQIQIFSSPGHSLTGEPPFFDRAGQGPQQYLPTFFYHSPVMHEESGGVDNFSQNYISDQSYPDSFKQSSTSTPGSNADLSNDQKKSLIV